VAFEIHHRDSLLATEEIDTMAEAIEKDHAVLRRRVADFRKAKFRLKKDLVFLKKENETLRKSKRNGAGISSYCEAEDSLENPTSYDSVHPNQNTEDSLETPPPPSQDTIPPTQTAEDSLK
jgi:hypothetical protein